MSGINTTGLSARQEPVSNWRKRAPSVTGKFSYILKHEQFSDVSFRVGENGGKIIKAHKLVLMTASEVFERMFTGNFKEASQSLECPIEVADMDPTSFKTMLKFMYTGEEPKNLTTSETIRVVSAARKYDISDLEELCWRDLTKKLRVEECVTILQVAQLYEKKTMEDGIFKFLKENFEKVMESEDFVHLSFENLSKLLSSADICVDTELQTFNGILRWSAAKCNEQNLTLTPANQRLVLGDVINLVNFGAIPAADVALTVVPSGILTFSECTLLLQHSAVSVESKKQIPPLPFSNVCRQRSTFIAKFSGVCEKPRKTIAIQNFIFKVDQRIKVVGFGFMGNPDPTIEYSVIYNFGSLSSSFFRFKLNTRSMVSSNSILTVDLDDPVEIKPNKHYSGNIIIEGPPIPWFRGCDDDVVNENGVNFTLISSRFLSLCQIKFQMIT